MDRLGGQCRRHQLSPQGEAGLRRDPQGSEEGVDWQGFETGEVDAILEVWGHDADRKTFIDDKKVAQDAGKMGVNGTIGWYVPGWMAKEHPDITDWNNLNKYADLFKTSESGDKGQFLLGDPSYVSNDQAIIDNLKLNYKVVAGGSEAALIESLKQATTQKTPLLAYFYDPQWAWSQEPLKSEPLVKINLPPERARLRRSGDRPEEGRLRLPGLRAVQGRLDEVRRERRQGLRADQELQLDEPRPEHDGGVHRQREDDAGSRGGQMGRRQRGHLVEVDARAVAAYGRLRRARSRRS